MIRQPLASTHSASTLDQHSSNPVTRSEREARHNHRAAIVTIAGRPALARAIERSLFHDGFNVKLLEASALYDAPLLPALNLLVSLGFIAIYSAASVPPELDTLPPGTLHLDASSLDVVNNSDASAAEQFVSLIKNHVLASTQRNTVQ